ncbi:MAG: aminotransferase class V-fold PLP-dependent enzyme [Pirellulales bacterium]
MRRIYLDNAATSWPKPESIYQAVDDYQRNCGAAAGRGAYTQANLAGRLVDRARYGVAQLLGGINPRQVVWTSNATDALNLALHGLLRSGDHVAATDLDHNSVLRPLHWLGETRSVAATYVPCDEQGRLSLDDFRAALRPETRLIVVNHASNVTGAIQPLVDIAELARERRIPLLVDAAQTLGQLEWPLAFDQPLLVAGAGHKSLLGPLGVGFLAISEEMSERVLPLRQGGTGTWSEDERQPTSLPERFESGNLNVPGLAGLAAGVDYVLQRSVAEIAAHHARLVHLLRDELTGIAGLRVFGPAAYGATVGVVSVASEFFEAHDLAMILDASCGIETRAGLHCAPRIHRRLGTLPRGGTVRLSLGAFTTEDEIHTAARALREIHEDEALADQGT